MQLCWAAGNADGKTVRLEYHDGTGWTNIVTGVSATDGCYAWDSTGFPDNFDAYWRVVAEDDSGVMDQTDAPFALRNQPHAFYVNDADQTGDMYCSTNGSGSNDGLTPGTPKLALQSIFDTYDLEGGDVVYVDTGAYASASDIRMIWSRSGSTNGDVVIQGSTNGARTVLTRSGSTNFPAVGLDVKASRIQLRDMAVRGINRGILLESNQNILVQGVMISEVDTGIDLDSTGNTIIQNSGFWRTGYGVDLSNTRTSVLQNLTFAASSLAGIRLIGTQNDTLQNNIFIPTAGAYAYSIGATTSLLYSVLMDYNLYDFSQAGSGFYVGATNSIRKWQLELNKDFRSAITNADLVDIDLTGDLHPHSEYGRWTSSGWLQDTTTSFAVDHGNPYMDFSQEPATNGGRRNIGMYGNTAQASMGNTNIGYLSRTMNEYGPHRSRRRSDLAVYLVRRTSWIRMNRCWCSFPATAANLGHHDQRARLYGILCLAGAARVPDGMRDWRVIGVNDTNYVGPE